MAVKLCIIVDMTPNMDPIAVFFLLLYNNRGYVSDFGYYLEDPDGSLNLEFIREKLCPILVDYLRIL